MKKIEFDVEEFTCWDCEKMWECDFAFDKENLNRRCKDISIREDYLNAINKLKKG